MQINERTARDRRDEAGYTMVELLVVLIFISIISSIALNAAMYAFDLSRTGRTVSDMRTVADALTRYQSDHGAYPAGGAQPVASIAPTLWASADVGPVLDGWRNPIYYEPFTTAQGTPTFRLFSYGKDGVSDGVVTGQWLDFYSDIVVEGGSFVQTRW